MKPKIIKGEFVELYNQTDLEFVYVYDCCKALKPLKGIDVNAQQVEFWYKEFLRMGWKKRDFDKQFEAVKRAKLFNRLDLENWTESEIMYNEIDLNVILDRRIDKIIREGRKLARKIELTEEEKRISELSAMNDLKYELTKRRYELMEQMKIDLREEYLKNLNGKKKILASMNMGKRIDLLRLLIKDDILPMKEESIEASAFIYHLEEWADKVPDKYLTIL